MKKPLLSWWGGYYGCGRPNLKTIRDVIASRATPTVVARWNDWDTPNFVARAVALAEAPRYLGERARLQRERKAQIEESVVRLPAARATAGCRPGHRAAAVVKIVETTAAHARAEATG